MEQTTNELIARVSSIIDKLKENKSDSNFPKKLWVNRLRKVCKELDKQPDAPIWADCINYDSF